MVKFGKLLPTAINLGRGFINATDPWLNYNTLKKLLYAICEERGLVIDKSAKGSGGRVPYPDKSPLVGEELAALLEKSPAEASFFRELNSQLEAISSFYDSLEAKLAARYDAVMVGLREFVAVSGATWRDERSDGGAHAADEDEGTGRTRSSSSSSHGSESSDTEALADSHLRLLTGLVSLFNQLVLLENYAVLNHCGFGKILKKHDKVAGWTGVKEAYMQSRVNPCPFATHRRLRRMVQGTKAAYDLLIQLSPVPEEELVMDGDDAVHLTLVQEVQLGLKAEKEKIHAATAAAASSPSPSPTAAGQSSASVHNDGAGAPSQGSSAVSSSAARKRGRGEEASEAEGVSNDTAAPSRQVRARVEHS